MGRSGNAQSEASVLYEQDFHAWLENQAALIRAGRLHEVDLEHVAEEIEDMGREQRHAVRFQLRHLLVYLLKLRFSPASDPRNVWMEAVQNARDEIEDRFIDSPSLRHHLDKLYLEVWPQAHRQAFQRLEHHYERAEISQRCPFTLEQVLDHDYWPD